MTQSPIQTTAATPRRSIFVIMPFTATPTRNTQQLTAFFENNLKGPIEDAFLEPPYLVRRSEDALNITDQIIRDLSQSDIVIADLSGFEGNPNVMYELGIRLAISSRPVILIRESHPNNKPIFDIGGLYAFAYDPLDYSAVTAHVLKKIGAFTSKSEVYQSPVLKILETDEPMIRVVSKNRAAYLLSVLTRSLMGTMQLFTGAVATLLHEHTSCPVTEHMHPTEVLKTLNNHRADAEAAPWDQLRYRAGSQPAVDAYIANLYLSGLVDSDLEEAFTAAVVEYHSFFLAGDPVFTNASYLNVVRYTGETFVLMTLADVLQRYLLVRTDTERAEARIQFQKTFRLRSFGVNHRAPNSR